MRDAKRSDPQRAYLAALISGNKLSKRPCSLIANCPTLTTALQGAIKEEQMLWRNGFRVSLKVTSGPTWYLKYRSAKADTTILHLGW